MRPLSAYEIRGMASALEGTFTSEAEVKRPTEGSDSAGGHTTVWNTVATLKCNYYHSSGVARAEQSEGTRLEIVEPWTFQVPAGSNVEHKDRLHVDARVFEVGSISGPQTVDIIWTLGCEEIL